MKQCSKIWSVNEENGFNLEENILNNCRVKNFIRPARLALTFCDNMYKTREL